MATLSFLPFVRRGLAAGIERLDDPTKPAGSATTELGLSLTVASGGTVTVQLPLVGPGEIVGLDPRVVVRTTPGADESDAEFGHFALIEFDQADLPWRYTPAQAGNDDRLRPWFSLIVLVEGPDNPEALVIPPSATQRLPIVNVTAPDVLPDLKQSWAWAHVQVVGEVTDQTLDSILRGRPGPCVARLLCPRVLKARTTYNAFLVPTFKRGALAGLGEPPGDIDALEPAWKKDTRKDAPSVQQIVELPVYYQWRFTTGSVGSFEDLARALEPQELPDTVGRRPMDVSVPGFGLPSAAPTQTALPVEGALQSPKAAAAPRPSVADAWVTALESFLNTQKVQIETPDGKTVEEMVVVPPLYGRWHAAQAQLAAQQNPPWFFRLNSDPRERVAASLGTAVVQRLQDDLLASAWRQLGSLRAANQARKVLQLGREAYVRQFDRHLRSVSRETFLLVTAYLHSRVVPAGANRTVAGLLDGSPIGLALFDSQWRRFARPRGAIGRRQGQPFAATAPPGVLDRLNDGRLDVDPEPHTPAGMSSFSGAVCPLAAPLGLTLDRLKHLPAQGVDPVLFWGLVLFCVARQALADNAGRSWWWILEALRVAIWMLRLAILPATASFTTRLCAAGPSGIDMTQILPAPNFTLVEDLPATPPPTPAPGAPGDQDDEDAALLRQALSDWVNNQRLPRLPLPVHTPVNLGKLADALRDGLSPRVTLHERHAHRFTGPAVDAWNSADDLEPIQAAPEFLQPMFGPLRDISEEWILPGIAQVAPNTVGVLLTNQAFVEAYMVGLNHELARELIWTGFPTDQRGSYFRHFWDSAGFITAGGSLPDPKDLPDIKPIHEWGRTQLGQNSAPRPAPGSSQLVLLVRGELIRRYPNVVIYAANEAAVRQTAGPIETHPVFNGQLGADIAFYGFGLDASQARDLFFVLQEQPAEPRFAVQPQQQTGENADPDKVPAATAAELAAKTWEQPVRVAIPGTLLLP